MCRLTNGRYSTQISAAGTGFSAFGDIALTRWSGDRVEDRDGQVLYMRDLETGAFWSVGRQPVGTAADRYDVVLRSDRAEITRLDDGIELRMELCVSPDDDLELRRYSVRNISNGKRHLEFTSYAELVLAPQAADTAHPAFSKLFVQTAWDRRRSALRATRRPRGADEKTVGAVCWLVASPGLRGIIEWETDRARFLGRGRAPSNPIALTSGAPLSGTTGNVLDPIFGLRCALVVEPDGERTFTIGLAAIGSLDDAGAVVDRHARPEDVERVFARASGRNAQKAEEPTEKWPQRPSPGFRPVPELPTRPDSSDSADAIEPLQFDNGYGGFRKDGREYVIRVGPTRRPPQPWTHVVANEDFGFIASESGAGFTWAVNSRLNRLTPWFNDPVTDPHGEALYIRDETAGVFWSPQPGPIPGNANYLVRFGFGTCRYSHVSGNLHQEVMVFVPRHDPVKVTRVTLRNLEDRERRLDVFAYARLVLGDQSSNGEAAIQTRWDPESNAVMARNPAREDFAGRVTFAAALAPPESGPVAFTTDRARFIGVHGSPAWPAALSEATALDGCTGETPTPCMALQVPLNIAANGTVDCVFLLGEAEDTEKARALVLKYREDGAIASALDEVRGFWRDTLGVVQVKTPVPAIDLMTNGWLLYQVLSCRLWARSAFYQSGGAFGFRDQLQDAAALAVVKPEMTRAQILLHAAHQFEEGDVLHWWHPPLSRGIRTRFSDDRLWLPFVAAAYIKATGDRAVLDETVPFVAAPPLAAGVDETYLRPTVTGRSASLYEHCCLALDCSLTKGAHGLPLMGTGDWNDGMNRVGREGRGESVWLGFFIHHLLDHFIPLCRERGDLDRAAIYHDYRADLAAALNDAGWDGSWYRRAYYDDGTPLGSADGDECRIDGLAQAWAVISDVAPPDRVRMALNAVEKHLISDRDGLIRLLTPPFENTPHDPGYIKGYVAGVRENGGQYTHAALWVVQAMAHAGRADRAAELLEMLSPVSHARTGEEAETYKVEPYVVAADVYGAPPHVARGGWTWYTGAAGWMYQVTLKSLLGFALEGGDTIALTPRIPPSWPAFDVCYRRPDGRTRYDISVRNAADRTGMKMTATVDGREIDANEGRLRVPIRDDQRRHRVEVNVGITRKGTLHSYE
jgi:cyclic beta-1,2-glucan synthetase